MEFPQWFSAFHEVPVWPGAHARVLHGQGGQIGFFTCSEEVEVPEHAHAGQWGVVLEGTLELWIQGEHHVYRKGESYSIPAGIPHRARIHPGTAFIDVWEGVRFPELAHG